MQLDELTQFLDSFFAVHDFDESGGIYQPSAGSIQRLGLALEPCPQLAAWVKHDRLDALFLHRPWKLQPSQLPPNIGVISYHLAFDERLTLGFNPRLAEVLSLSRLEVLGKKEGRAIGMIGEIPSQGFDRYRRQVEEVFGGQDEGRVAKWDQVTRVAIVGAMTDALVRQAAERGASVYITGQFRSPAELAVSETGIGAIVVGHRRSEMWGLRALAGILRERWAELEIVLPPFY